MKTGRRQTRTHNELLSRAKDGRTHCSSTNCSGGGKPGLLSAVRPILSDAHSEEPRPIRANLAKRLLAACAACKNAAEPQEHVASRPEIAHALLEDAFTARASDIHLEPRDSGMRVRLRIDGVVSDVASLSVELGKWLRNQFKVLANLDPVVRFTPKDSHARVVLNGCPIDLRMALAPSQGGEALSIRMLDPKRLERSIDDLGLTKPNLELLEQWLDHVSGMFLAAGPTGCGKTTTVYALLHS